MRKYKRYTIVTLSALLFLCGCTQAPAGMGREMAGLAEVNATAGETAEPDAGDPIAQEDSAVGQTAEPASSRQYQDGIQRAESVFPYDGGILISNFGGSQGGYVLYRKDGNTEMLIAPGEGLEAPTGLAAGNGMLFVCDGDVLKVFEIKDPGKGFCEIRLDGNSHLFNDVAIDGSYLYLSVTDQDAVYRMDISNTAGLAKATLEYFVEVPGPNGITIGNRAMYIATISKDFTSVGADNIIYVIRDLTDPKTERLVDVAGLYDGVALSDNGSILYYSDWNTASVEAIDLISGERKQIYQEDGMGPADIAQKDGILYVPDLPGSRILEFHVQAGQEMAETAEYKTKEIHVDKEGMDIYGVVHIPSGTEERMPVVIMSHELGATLDRVKGYGEALTKEGYVTVCFDFSGGGLESRSDGEMLDMSVLTEKADLEAVLEEVKQWDFVDTGSIYLMGNSQGGFVTALTAAEHREEIRAVILIYPALCIYDDVHEMFDSPEEIPETHNLLGLRLRKRYFMDAWDLEPYERIKEYGKNILLMHGDSDSIVPISYSDKLAETIDHVEYHVIQGADHGYQGKDFELAVSYIRDFLKAEQAAAQD